jgi:hypothetical protein
MSDKTYYQKLKDPRWQKLRLEAMQKADFCCEMCYDKESPLNVHHKEYFKGHEPWEYHVNQLAVLCESCHEYTHDEFNLLKWVCSLAPADGPGERNELAFLIGGFNNISYDGMLSISCKNDAPYYKNLWNIGKRASDEALK